MAQIQQTSYRGAFAPAPTAMWTNGWTNFDPNNAVYGAVTTVISTDITSNTTWDKTKVYELNGLITVRNNATLTIPAGTVIRSNVSASCLVITRGAKLIANGTAAEPIIFTSLNAAGSRQRGDWGGIVLLGKGRYNLNSGVNFIEGLSQNVNTQFGGGTTPIDNDSSGSLQYVRIEFAGFVFAPNNELNGLTMGAVGSGTTIDYVQVSYSNDDSFEWFGGSVNGKHLVAFAGLDDDFDTDNGYNGYNQFVLGVRDPAGADISDSEGFESDNSNTATSAVTPYTQPVFTNCTLVGPTGRGVAVNSFYKKAIRLRRSTKLSIFNSIFLDFRQGLSIEDTFTPGFATSVDGSGNYNGDLKFKNNIIAGIPTGTFPVGSFINGTSTPATALNTWFYAPANANVGSATSSAGVLTRLYNATTPLSYLTITDNLDTANVDYRPGTAAATGASFTDAVFNGLITVGAAPGVSPKTYCKGAVAPALTANLTATGVSLVWYSKPKTVTIATAVGVRDLIVLNPDGTQTITVNGLPDILAPVVDTPLASAPTPLTTVVGTKYFWVSELDATGTIESARASIAVTTNASPLVALAAITGPVDSITLIAAAPTTVVSTLIGTTTTATYTVAASLEVGIASYLWTVPLGVNIISGQNTNTIVVNYANVPAGSLKVGNIAVQAVNAGGCPGVLKTLAITAVLPAAPAALVLNDGTTKTVLGITSPVALTSFAKYMGTTTPLTVTATPVAAATSYVWELPTGVNLLNLTAPVTTTLYYNVFPFTVSSASAPTTAGNVYYKIDRTSYANGTSVTVGRIIRNARAATGALPAITAFNNELTNLTNEGVTVNPAYPITATTSNIISVNFAGVTSGNTFAYNVVNATTGAITPTYAMRIGVKSRNGVGASVTANATAVNPTTTSTAKLLTLKATLPAAPSAIKMTNAAALDPSLAVTVISKFIGTPTVFTLTATPSVLASSYVWELPADVNLVSPLASLSTNVITVNFAGVAPGTLSLYIGVKAVNGIGVSNTITNGTLVPATSSTAKLLKLTSALPAAVSVVAGQIAGICGGSSYSYTMTASLLANSYVITAPTNSVVTSVSNPANASNILATSDLIFTVTYPAVFVATTAAPKAIVISSVNGVGSSLLNKTVALSTLMPVIGVATGGTTFTRCANQTFSIPPVAGATDYLWTVVDGAVIVSGQGTTSVEVDFAAVAALKTSNLLKVVATNSCGASTAAKSITLTSTACPVVARIASTNLTVTSTEVYPNPSTNVFNIDITASIAGSVQVSVYTFDGNVVSTKVVKLHEGSNTITEDISSLNNGIYFVQIANASTNEVIVKKMIKQ